MKKVVLALVVMMLGVISAKAVPAMGNLVKVQQPDGTTVSIRLVGDEYLHYNITTDGYSVVKNDRGYYVYAQRSAEGQLVPTAQIAHDEAARPASEVAFLASIKKYIQPDMSEMIVQEKSREQQRRQQASQQRRGPNYDYSKFHGLVILVEYNDRTFDTDDFKETITAAITEEGYTGYYDYNGHRVNCTGSVYDYFNDNSMGMFQPKFDIVGPVQVDRSQYYPRGTSSSASQLMVDVINAVDPDVNFKDYDTDGDGEVDMIYFIFAGHGANVGGNDSRLLWPHASSIYNPQTYQWVYKDGVRLGRYACSTELTGSDKYSRQIDGIGTICHEFSHVLGLPDFYDTDYEGSGGESNDPGNWSVMAGGCYNNNSRTPSGYSLFERYMLGFATPEVINGEGSFTLNPLPESNTGFRINTPVKKEYFILENRQQKRWDQYLPGHGMLVFRVDSTNANVWRENSVNNNPKHNYYELVRARGPLSSGAGDPFPGSGRKTTLNNSTTPANLLTWSGKETQWGLNNIKETSGVISFDIEDTYILRELNAPDTLIVGLGMNRKLQVEPVPEYAHFSLTYSSSNDHVAFISHDGVVTGITIGTATITVTSDNGLSVQTVIEVKEMATSENIAAFKAQEEEGQSVLQLQDAQVLYVYKNDAYVRDASGAIVFHETGLNLKQNDVLNGSFYGQFARSNRMPWFVTVEGMSDSTSVTITEGKKVEYRHVKLGTLTEADYADLLAVDTVQLVRESGVFAVEGDVHARLYNTFGLKNLKVPTTVDNKRFNVLCIYGTRLLNGEVIDELYLLESPKEVKWVDPSIIDRSLSENVIKAEVRYETTEPNYVEKKVELTDEQVNEILADLQLESFAKAEVYGWNPTTEEFIADVADYDGWRNAKGDFAKWTGDASVPACVKYTDGKTYLCYNINGCEEQEIKCYWAIANDKRAVLVEITFVYEIPAGINEQNADLQAGAIYNINGVRMQNI
ncbi:MAG: M6 family metalloprotease domain-containing protein [Bacteroidaceae bacterium]|nr:M6 family metalloprotease domain-containing protein [Bacteroidaceae bacterium]